MFFTYFFSLVIIYFLSCSHMPKLRIYFFLLFLQSFHVIYRYLPKNELASRNVGRRIADIYIYEEYDIRKKMARWRLSVAKGVAEWIYRREVNGEKEAEDRERSLRVTLFFSSALQRYADVGGRKRTTEKLKWTPAGIFSERERRRKKETEFPWTRSAVLHSWLLTPFSILIWTEIFTEREHFPWNFHNFCIIQKCTSKKKNEEFKRFFV